MVVKSNTATAAMVATRQLEKVIASHRSYFSEWRSNKFDQPESVREPSDKTGSAESSKRPK